MTPVQLRVMAVFKAPVTPRVTAPLATATITVSLMAELTSNGVKAAPKVPATGRAQAPNPAANDTATQVPARLDARAVLCHTSDNSHLLQPQTEQFRLALGSR